MRSIDFIRGNLGRNSAESLALSRLIKRCPNLIDLKFRFYREISPIAPFASQTLRRFSLEFPYGNFNEANLDVEILEKSLALGCRALREIETGSGAERLAATLYRISQSLVHLESIRIEAGFFLNSVESAKFLLKIPQLCEFDFD